MQAEHWLKVWKDGRIGFNQKNVNSRLKQYWPSLNIQAQAPVFVPLCGKSVDMLWLHQQGHGVLGIDLSEKAAQAFFDENQLPFEQSRKDGFDFYTGIDQALGITLMVGDFFNLGAAHLAHCPAFYDRASLIAMPETMQADYTAHLSSIMEAGSQGLLLTIAYEQSRMQGPPFSVPDKTVQDLLSSSFGITELEYFSGPERLGNLAQRGLETLEERVYLLERNTSKVN